MAMSRPMKRDELLIGLECPVCHEHYRSPKILPCGHTLCLSPCLEQITAGKPKLRCPECRTEHDVPNGGAVNFPTNVTVARLFEKPKHAEHSLECPICGEEEDKVKCLHCGLMVCCECRQNHNGKFRDQLIENLVMLMEEKTPAAIKSCKDKRVQLEASLKENSQLAIQRIRDASERAHKTIDDNVQDLINSVEEYEAHEMKVIQQKDKEILQNLQDVLGFCHSSVKDLKQNTFSQSKMKKLLSKYTSRGQLVAESKSALEHSLHDLYVTTNEQEMVKVSRSLAQVVIVPRIDETTQHQEEETKVDSSTMTEKSTGDEMVEVHPALATTHWPKQRATLE